MSIDNDLKRIKEWLAYEGLITRPEQAALARIEAYVKASEEGLRVMGNDGIAGSGRVSTESLQKGLAALALWRGEDK